MKFDVTLNRLEENRWIATCPAFPDHSLEGKSSGEVLAKVSRFLEALLDSETDCLSFSPSKIPTIEVQVVCMNAISEERLKRLRAITQLARTPSSLPSLSKKSPREKFFAVAGAVVGIGYLLGMVFGSASPSSSASAVSSSPVHSAFGTFLKYAVSTLIIGSLLFPLIKGKMQPYFRFFRLLRPRMAFESVGVIAAVIATAIGIGTLFPFLDRSWLYLIPASDGDATNLVVMPATLKYVGLAFLVMLALCLPRFAHDEEIRFRLGTQDWRDGFKRSLRFGLAHCLMGVPLYAGLALTVGGLWFTLQYFKGGIERSTAYHLAYNLLVLVLLATYLIVTRVVV